MAAPYLEIESPEGKKRMALGSQPITIGRHSTNILMLTDDLASRFHCVVEKVSEGFRVRDLGSRNGTHLNGKPVQSALLLSGDVVQIGKTKITLIAGAPAREPAVQKPAAVQRPAPVAGQGKDDFVVSDDIPGDDYDPDSILEEAAALEAAAGQEAAQAEAAEFDEDRRDPKADPEAVLQRIAESLPEKMFDETDINLVNARGQVTHAGRAAPPAKGKKAAPQAEQSEAVIAFRLLLLVCFRSRASDVHVEPKNDFTQIRIRVDGTMVDVLRVSKEMGVRLTAVVKILCDIDISQKNIIQEGHFTVRLPDRRVDYRVSFAPAMFGQKLVIRVLDTANTPLYLWDLQLPQWMFEEIQKAITRESGMILVCGPTGSGKTTTLYAVVRSIDANERNVVTIEDPVEIQLDGVTQIPVNEEQGNSFPSLLRSVLRQDPDAILVGEVRDAETARIAMQAAMTGHIVFSTVHSRDTIGTIFRLIDLGVEPYLVASGLHLVLAQRLVRRLCPYCKTPTKPTAEQLQRMGDAAKGAKQFFKPGACQKCLGTGYSGRRAVFELLSATEQLREVILKNPTLEDIKKALAGTAFVRLVQTGYQLVAEGTTDFEEIDRAVGAENKGILPT